MAVAASLFAPSPLAAQEQVAPTAGTDPQPAPAVDAPANGTESQILLPADFARFAPRTALDMVLRIPDFTLTESSGDRGLGQASENVLINGQRVSGKSNDANSALANIAADAVERIEMLDGARLNMPGLTGRVANVVTRTSRWTTQFRWEGQERRYLPFRYTTGSISATGRIGASDVTISLSNANGFRRGGFGPITYSDAAGAIFEEGTEHDIYRGDRPRLAGTLRREWANGAILNLNLSGELFIFDANLDQDLVTLATGQRNLIGIHTTEDERFVEAGGDYEFALGGGRLKLIALQSYEHSPVVSTLINRSVSTGATTGSRYAATSDEGESVLRAEYAWNGGGGQWQASIEGAYNFLDTSAWFGLLQADGGFAADPFAPGTAFIDEWRAEALLTRGWTLATGLTVQLTGGGEYSRLRQAGAGGLTRHFWRPKGSVALNWTVDPRLTINLDARRQVGQLSFYDFVAAVDLDNNNQTGANFRLVPEQSWRVKAEMIRRIGALGSITLGGYREWITDIVDRIPLGTSSEGVGNLPRADRWGVTFSGTLAFDSVGVPGARLNVSGDVRRSRVADPLTGVRRSISEDLVRLISAEFRYDWPGTDWAWGTALLEERYSPVFRLDEYAHSILDQPVLSTFIEHKDVAGLTVRFTIRNLLGARDDLIRDVYVNRRNGPLDFRERQFRHLGAFALLSVSGSF